MAKGTTTAKTKRGEEKWNIYFDGEEEEKGQRAQSKASEANGRKRSLAMWWFGFARGRRLHQKLGHSSY